MSQPILQLENITVGYDDGLTVLSGVDIAIQPGEVVALMGPNGAGKSTVLKTIFGLTIIKKGKLYYKGEVLKPVSHEVVQKGIAFVPQGRRVFRHLTVEENLEIGGFVLRNADLVKERIASLYKLFPILKQKRKAAAGSLSGGQQQTLAIARGMMTAPDVLLLDEPTLGLSPKLVRETFAEIKKINTERKTTIVIVEHNIKSLLNFVNQAYVLSHGKVVTTGTPEELHASDILEKVFMGALQ